jgi:dTDP-4-amino-4,6-dideoxygalactose transaminase
MSLAGHIAGRLSRAPGVLRCNGFEYDQYLTTRHGGTVVIATQEEISGHAFYRHHGNYDSDWSPNHPMTERGARMWLRPWKWVRAEPRTGTAKKADEYSARIRPWPVIEALETERVRRKLERERGRRWAP